MLIGNEKNACARFKDILRDAKSNGTLYKLEVAAARVDWKHPHITAYNEELSQERDDLIQKEVKARENRRSAQQTFNILGRQIRGSVKPNSAKNSGLTRVEVELRNHVWKQLTGKEEIEEHLIARNVVKFSHAGSTPFGYTPLGKELGHTGDSPIANKIYNGTLDHEALNEEAINAIVIQLRKHPVILLIWTVTTGPISRYWSGGTCPDQQKCTTL
jgi:hypothetical protein